MPSLLPTTVFTVGVGTRMEDGRGPGREGAKEKKEEREGCFLPQGTLD